MRCSNGIALSFVCQSEVDLDAQFNFREMALEELAKRAILLRLAEQYGVVITQQELEDSIAGMAPFQEQGRFSLARYQAVLRSQVPPIAPRQFEAQQRQALVLQKVIDAADGGNPGDGRRSRTDVSSRQ